MVSLRGVREPPRLRFTVDLRKQVQVTDMPQDFHLPESLQIATLKQLRVGTQVTHVLTRVPLVAGGLALWVGACYS